MRSESILDHVALALGTLALRLTYGGPVDMSSRRSAMRRWHGFLPLLVLAAAVGGAVVWDTPQNLGLVDPD